MSEFLHMHSLSYVLIMEGMTKNPEREQDELKGVQRTHGDANDFMEFMQNQ